MPVPTPTIIQGPAIATFQGSAIYFRESITVTPQVQTFMVGTDLHGEIDERLQSLSYQITGTLADAGAVVARTNGTAVALSVTDTLYVDGNLAATKESATTNIWGCWAATPFRATNRVALSYMASQPPFATNGVTRLIIGDYDLAADPGAPFRLLETNGLAPYAPPLFTP